MPPTTPISPSLAPLAAMIRRVAIGASPRTTTAGLVSLGVLLGGVLLEIETVEILGHTLTITELALVVGYAMLARTSGDGAAIERVERVVHTPTPEQPDYIPAVRHPAHTPKTPIKSGDTI